MKTPPRPTQRAAVERLWRRAEEIRSLCGLPPLTGYEPGAPEGSDAAALEPLVELLLRDLETNFRRELATRVQLEGLGELFAFAARDTEPGRPYQILINYLARALDEPRLWLGIVDGSPASFTVFRAGDPAVVDVSPDRVPVQWLQPDWLHWIALGEGNRQLWIGPSGSRKGGPWHPVPVRGEIALDRLTGEVPICPGAAGSGKACGLSRLPLEEMAGGHRACGACQFRHVVALIGVEGTDARQRRSQIEAVVPSLGPILVNLGLKEVLDLEARFRDEVIENLPLGVVAIDTRGRVLAWNRSAEMIVGLDREAVRSTPLPRLLAERSWHEVLVRSLEMGETTVGAEHDIVRPDGSSVPTEVSTAPLRDSEGRIRGAVATLLDVSSLKDMEDRIRQLDRLAALGRFASSVAHELRNPLTGIATGVQYLSRGFPPGDERHESVAFILREVVRLNRIIQDLFTATKPREILPRPTRVSDVVDWAVRGLSPTIETSGVRIERPGADTWPTVTADTDQLQQVLLNLIQNAVQATPKEGVVTIRAFRRPGDRPSVVIQVEDTGPGIAPDLLPRIFEPFFTTRPKGTGLGLFVAHGIVQRHGGTLEVESGATGARFRVVLPVAEE
ncbi:MAG: two-component system sensor histidine kinase NtrB [Bacteroidota bacterium]